MSLVRPTTTTTTTTTSITTTWYHLHLNTIPIGIIALCQQNLEGRRRRREEREWEREWEWYLISLTLFNVQMMALPAVLSWLASLPILLCRRLPMFFFSLLNYIAHFAWSSAGSGHAWRPGKKPHQGWEPHRPLSLTSPTASSKFYEHALPHLPIDHGHHDFFVSLSTRNKETTATTTTTTNKTTPLVESANKPLHYHNHYPNSSSSYNLSSFPPSFLLISFLTSSPLLIFLLN